MNNTHIIIYSHGFGVKKDDRGLFTDIAASFPDAVHVLFDYNDVDEVNNILTVKPFSEQSRMLQHVVAEQRVKHPDAIIDLICHSQGTRIATKAKLSDIRKTIFLAPPVDGGAERTIKRYIDNPACEINLEGISRLARTDGSTTLIPAEYWAERKGEPSPIYGFNELANMTELTIIKAAQDHVTGDTKFEGLSDAVTLLEIEGDHDFTTTRDLLVQHLQKLLQ